MLGYSSPEIDFDENHTDYHSCLVSSERDFMKIILIIQLLSDSSPETDFNENHMIFLFGYYAENAFAMWTPPRKRG